MDGATFDALVKRLTQTRLTRWEALRGCSPVPPWVWLAPPRRRRPKPPSESARARGAPRRAPRSSRARATTSTKCATAPPPQASRRGRWGGRHTHPAPPSPPLSPPNPPAPPSPPATTTTGAHRVCPAPPPSPPPLGELPPCTPEGRACQQHASAVAATASARSAPPSPARAGGSDLLRRRPGAVRGRAVASRRPINATSRAASPGCAVPPTVPIGSAARTAAAIPAPAAAVRTTRRASRTGPVP